LQKPLPLAISEAMFGIKTISLFFLLIFLCISLTPVSLVSTQSATDAPAQAFWKQEGPWECSGRITSIAIDPQNKSILYLSSASGGLWRSTDAGAHFEPVFTKQGAMAIGTVAISPHDSKEIWLGGGECNPSLYSFPGKGLYVSRDGGNNWMASGLEQSRRIARIRFHPKAANTMWVAVLGDVYQDSRERGLFKSQDGGRNWKQVLYPGPDCGCIDLIVHPQNPDILWAATWSLRRQKDHFRRSGENSSIWISRNGGENWTRSHFPSTYRTGRIGLDVAIWSGKEVLFASVDDLTPRPQEGTRLTVEQLARLSTEEIFKIPDKQLQALLDSHQVPRAFDAGWIKGMLKQGQLQPVTIANFLMDEEARRLSDDAIGITVFRSDDLGLNWNRVNRTLFRETVYSYGFYFGQIRCTVKDQLYLLGVPLLLSKDGGQNFINLTSDQRSVHRDMHDLWIDPQNPSRLILATDGGLYQSSDQGRKWKALGPLPISQAYRMAISPLAPYDLYLGLQDNGIFRKSTEPEGQWSQIWGADGTMIIPDPNHAHIFYGGHQHGNLYHFNLKTRNATTIKPRAVSFSSPYRFNWLAPAILSHHDPHQLYLAANQLLFSPNEGQTWLAISPDLSTLNPGKESDVPFGTISAVAESKFDATQLYAGTDNGKLWRSRNGGSTWQEIGVSLSGGRINDILTNSDAPQEVWVVIGPLPQEPGPSSLLYSDNGADDWMLLDIPLAAARGLRKLIQDPVQKSLFFLAGDEGVWISPDRGHNWFESSQQALPPVFDLMVHPQSDRLYIATHGQGVFSCDVSKWRKR